MDRSEKIFFSVLEYISETSEAESCLDFVKEVLAADEECRKALSNPSSAPTGRVNTVPWLKGGL